MVSRKLIHKFGNSKVHSMKGESAMKTSNMNKFSMIGLLLAILGSIAAGCVSSAQAQVVKSNKRRETSPSISTCEFQELVEGNNAFAFDLYQTLKDEGDNIVYSPYSISLVLAMVYILPSTL
jgi:serine protease inhibitor